MMPKSGYRFRKNIMLKQVGFAVSRRAVAIVLPALAVTVAAFAVEAQDARTIAGQDVCGWIGVTVRPMTAPIAESLGMAEPYGAIFDRPEPGGPAAAALIQEGDVLTTVGGEPLRNSTDFAGLIAAMAPGEIVHLGTWRDTQYMEPAVMLGSGPCPPTPPTLPTRTGSG